MGFTKDGMSHRPPPQSTMLCCLWELWVPLCSLGGGGWTLAHLRLLTVIAALAPLLHVASPQGREDTCLKRGLG